MHDKPQNTQTDSSMFSRMKEISVATPPCSTMTSRQGCRAARRERSAMQSSWTLSGTLWMRMNLKMMVMMLRE